MKRILCLCSGLIAAFSADFTYGQGPLTPPGAPAPSMKSLDHLEARTPISSLPFLINTSGSYYLTKNLSVTTGDAITVTADQVTLDLNGFTISSTASPAGGSGVLLAKPGGNIDITIRDGHVKGGITFSGGTYSGNGFANGIVAAPNNALNSSARGLTFSTTFAGLRASNVTNCFGQSNGADPGIDAESANGCQGNSLSGPGIAATTALNCSGASNSGPEIHATTALNCIGSSVSSQGISALAIDHSYGGSGSNRGISTEIATACYGITFGSSFGINASRFANGCFGSSDTGTGLVTNLAVACIGINSSGPAISYTSHYNMPP